MLKLPTVFVNNRFRWFADKSKQFGDIIPPLVTFIAIKLFVKDADVFKKNSPAFGDRKGDGKNDF